MGGGSPGTDVGGDGHTFLDLDSCIESLRQTIDSGSTDSAFFQKFLDKVPRSILKRSRLDHLLNNYDGDSSGDSSSEGQNPKRERPILSTSRVTRSTNRVASDGSDWDGDGDGDGDMDGGGDEDGSGGGDGSGDGDGSGHEDGSGHVDDHGGGDGDGKGTPGTNDASQVNTGEYVHLNLSSLQPT